jgi:hypothetical protein
MPVETLRLFRAPPVLIKVARVTASIPSLSIQEVANCCVLVGDMLACVE